MISVSTLLALRLSRTRSPKTSLPILPRKETSAPRLLRLLAKIADELPNVTLGITLHEKAGQVNVDESQGWFRYWEPHDGSELSTAIVVDPDKIMEFIDHRVEEKDLSNLLVVCKPDKELTYYAGFAWKKSNQFGSTEEFDSYLANFAARLANPLVVSTVEQ